MKSRKTGKRIATTTALLVLACSIRADRVGAADTAARPGPSALAQSRPSPEKDLDVLSQAQSHIAAREYWASETQDGLQAPNRRHGLRSYFEPAGLRVHDRTAAGSPRLFGLQLAGLGRGEDLSPVAAGEVTHAAGRVEIRRPGLVEWFENSAEGLEQGFTLAARPQAPAPTLEPVVLELAVTGAKASLLGSSVVFATEAGRKLEYGKLAVVDAKGRALVARFDVPLANRIRLVVDDSQAVYPISIDPLLTDTADAEVEGNQAVAVMGWSVASAGDVNADGYADVIIGARLFDAGQTDEGAAFVFLGSAAGIASGDPLTAAAQLESNQPLAELGYSVSSAGDVNGDGYADVIVGARYYDAGQVDEGAAFIFLGSAAGIADGNPLTAHARIESNQSPAELGNSVSSAGDINGDGYGDVIVGAHSYTNGAGQDGEGAAFLFLGSAGGIANGNPLTAHARFESNQPSAQLGIGVASAGDVNGDGYGDVIVGAHTYANGEPAEGSAFVFLGSAAGITNGSPITANARLESNQANALMGVSVSSAGDVNGDGYGDVIVGASIYNNGESGEGAAFVFLGSGSGIANGNPLTAQALLESNQVNASLGYSVASAGDVNGDGYGDVIVGSPGYSAGESREGAAFVFLGSAIGIDQVNPGEASAQLESNQVDAEMGTSVASAGDVDGDGFADVIVGAPFYENGAGQDFEGAAFVYRGGGQGFKKNLSRATLLESSQASAQLGVSVASAGDVNGDGYGDVIVGAYGYDSGEADEGAAFIFLGSASGLGFVGGPATAHARLESNQSDAQMGIAVASAGDVNGDGYGDVIVGAHRYDNGDTDEGAAFIFLGSAGGVANGNPATAHARLESNQVSARMGIAVASAGDVNGDGYGDVIVGADRYSGPEIREGAAFVFLGSASGIANGSPATAHARIESNQGDAELAGSVASAGDINGDGFGDVIVGARFYSNGQAQEGAAFIFLGSSNGIANGNVSAAHARIEANESSVELGTSVASAGDVNGDGYGDVIVGAPKRFLFVGRFGFALIYLGSATGIPNGNLASAHAALGTGQLGDDFGVSVASAGDVNGDGYGDLIVGADFQSAGGAAFVFLGSASGIVSSTSANGVLSEGQLGSGMGRSAASAGDVNGDGYSDVIVGANLYDAPGQADEGAAFVYLGNSKGRPVVTRQRRASGSSPPIAPGGLSIVLDRFVVEHFVASPRGRERAKLEVEICPTAKPFGHVSCLHQFTSSSWLDLGTSGAMMTGTITGLVPSTLYSWRSRALYVPLFALQPGVVPRPRVGPWFRLQGRATPGDVRTVPEPGIGVGLMAAMLLLRSLGGRRRSSSV